MLQIAYLGKATLTHIQHHAPPFNVCYPVKMRVVSQPFQSLVKLRRLQSEAGEQRDGNVKMEEATDPEHYATRTSAARGCRCVTKSQPTRPFEGAWSCPMHDWTQIATNNMRKSLADILRVYVDRDACR